MAMIYIEKNTDFKRYSPTKASAMKVFNLKKTMLRKRFQNDVIWNRLRCKIMVLYTIPNYYDATFKLSIKIKHLINVYKKLPRGKKPRSSKKSVSSLP